MLPVFINSCFVTSYIKYIQFVTKVSSSYKSYPIDLSTTILQKQSINRTSPWLQSTIQLSESSLCGDEVSLIQLIFQSIHNKIDLHTKFASRVSYAIGQYVWTEVFFRWSHCIVNICRKKVLVVEKTYCWNKRAITKCIFFSSWY